MGIQYSFSATFLALIALDNVLYQIHEASATLLVLTETQEVLKCAAFTLWSNTCAKPKIKYWQFVSYESWANWVHTFGIHRDSGADRFYESVSCAFQRWRGGCQIQVQVLDRYMNLPHNAPPLEHMQDTSGKAVCNFFLMSSRDRHRSATYPIIWSMHKPLEVAWSWKDSGISLGQLLSTRVPLEQASLNGRPQSSSEPSNHSLTK